MTLVKWHPHTFNHLARTFEHGGQGGCAWNPRADILEQDDAYQIVIELPGMEKKDISIKLENRVLSVSGQREVANSEQLRRRERFSGEFCRSFRIPSELEGEKVEAEFKSGLLSIRLPKGKQMLVREIEIR